MDVKGKEAKQEARINYFVASDCLPFIYLFLGYVTLHLAIFHVYDGNQHYNTRQSDSKSSRETHDHP